MKQRRVILLSACLMCVWMGMSAQQQRLQYWFDSNAASPEQITDSSDDAFTFEVDAQSLSPGIHTLSIRIQDNTGNWSVPMTHYFLRINPQWSHNPNITQYEYWIDHNGSTAQRCEADAEGLLSFDLDADALTVGVHSVSIRAMDGDGCWGTPITHYFMRIDPRTPETPDIAQFEYWFDHDGSTAQRTEADAEGLISFDLDAGTLAEGIHSVSIRAMDDAGRWGTPITHYFLRTNPRLPETYSIARYEYWVDHKPAMRQEAVGSDALIIDIDVDTLQAGLHTLSVRSQDNSGAWSVPIVHYFYHRGHLHEPSIAGFQYWFNDAYNHAVYQAFEPGQTTVVINKNVMTRDLRKREPTAEELESGEEVNLYYGLENLLHYRFMDDTGTYGHIMTDTFTYIGDGEKIFLAETDWRLLRQAHSMTGGDEWKAQWEFGETSEEPVVLPGVTINDDGHATDIELKDYNMAGPFPYPMLQLPALKTLTLADNQLAGDVCQGIPEDLNAPALHTLNISGNQLTGNVGLLASHLPHLTHLDAARNKLHSVWPVISERVTYLNIQGQVIDEASTLHIGHLSPDTITACLPSIVTYNHQEQKLSPDVSLQCSTTDGEWSMKIDYQEEQLMVSTSSSERVYRGQAGDTLQVTSHGQTFPMRLFFDNGDANFDGDVNVLDLQTCVNRILETYNNELFNFTATNLWSDNLINAQDAVLLVNILLDAAPEGSIMESRYKRVREYDTDDAEAYLYMQDGQLMLYINKPVAALDITIDGADELELSDDLRMSDMMFSFKRQHDGLHIVAYSLSGETLPVGETLLGTATMPNAVPSRAMLATEDARPVLVSISNSSPTGLGHIKNGTSESELPAYDLQGRRVGKGWKGIYIQRGRKEIKLGNGLK